MVLIYVDSLLSGSWIKLIQDFSLVGCQSRSLFSTWLHIFTEFWDLNVSRTSAALSVAKAGQQVKIS